eukprot:218738-Pyramimonas_sp.AAC.1
MHSGGATSDAPLKREWASTEGHLKRQTHVKTRGFFTSRGRVKIKRAHQDENASRGCIKRVHQEGRFFHVKRGALRGCIKRVH